MVWHENTFQLTETHPWSRSLGRKNKEKYSCNYRLFRGKKGGKKEDTRATRKNFITLQTKEVIIMLLGFRMSNSLERPEVQAALQTAKCPTLWLNNRKAPHD